MHVYGGDLPLLSYLFVKVLGEIKVPSTAARMACVLTISDAEWANTNKEDCYIISRGQWWGWMERDSYEVYLLY